MKFVSILLILAMLTGCGSSTVATVSPEPETTAAMEPAVVETTPVEIPYVSRFSEVTQIQLSDDGITVDGGSETDAVFTSRDIIYYEDRDAYDSGNPYGEGGRGPGGDRQNMTPPEGFEGRMPEGFGQWDGEIPKDFEDRRPEGMPGGFGGQGGSQPGEASTEFYMNDMVNSFSGVKTV